MRKIIKKIKGLINRGICKNQPISAMHEEEKQLRDLYEGVQYDPNLFKVYVGEDKYIMGYMSPTPDDNPDKSFFMYKTLYDTIVDLDGKIKKSFDLALRWEYSSDIDHFNMVSPPSAEEEEAIYYTENAVFRTSALWDLLAQLYNVKYKNNHNPDKVYYHTLFHNDTQGKHPNPLAKKIYAYITEVEEEDRVYETGEFWKGNHEYVSEYRNKMTHRNSPNVPTMSNYAFELRMPMRYVLKRVIEDYVKASEFIKQILDEIISDFSE